MVTANFEIAPPLKYLGKFLRTLEMPLINCEINFSLSLNIFTWPANCVICSVDKARTFAITDSKLYVSEVTLPSQDNT